MPPSPGDTTAPDVQYNSMQQQAGLLPAVAIPPPVVFPGQISAMLATGGPGAAMGALPQMFPGNTYQTMTGAPPMYQGPTGVMQPQMPSAPYNPYPGPNPYAGLGAFGPPSIFAPPYAAPPPLYAGPQGGHVVPFGPAAPPAMFDTPYGARLTQTQAADDRAFAMNAAGAGLGARIGTNALAGMAGAAIGSRFGGWGAAIGGAIGFFGSEFGGLGQAGQNSFMNNVMGPSIQQRALAGGIEHASTQFVPFGGSLHASGTGFSHHAAMEASRGLMDLGNSASFRRETFDRFNTQDLSKITQASAHAGLMSGVDNPADMVSRVRDIAKSVNAFMELAKEPDIQRAIQTMGSLRASGLNLSETLGAVQSGRTFARMAGMSFQEMAEVGGSMGSSTFQSMGLSQGLGFRTGTANLGIASASRNAGILSPQMLSMVGGSQGLANLNNMFSAGMLQLPMLAPGMMTANGGLDPRAIQGFLSGRSDLFSMTGRGSSVLSGMAGRHGVEGLGMAVAMQPMLQDQIGRIMAAQGPFAQRNIEDTQITQLARQMNMRGSAGFITAAQAMGMSQSQALARAQEISSPGYYSGQRQQLNVRAQEHAAEQARLDAADAPTAWGTLRRTTFVGNVTEKLGAAWDAVAKPIGHFLAGDHTDADNVYIASTDSARRRVSRVAQSRSYLDYARRVTRGADKEELEQGFTDRVREGRALAEAYGGRGVASWIGGVGIASTGTDAERRSMARSFAESASYSRLLLHGNEGAEREASRNMAATFGRGAAGINAMVDFSGAISQMSSRAPGITQGATGMLINAGVRAGAMFVTGGVLDPGNIVGQGANSANQFRDAFVNTMVKNQGMTRAQATELFSKHGEEIIMQAAPLTRLQMRPEDRERLRQNINVGERLGPRAGTTRVRADRDERAGYRDILGDHKEHALYNRFMDNLEGIGKEGSDRYERSRYIISALAMTSGVMQNAGPDSANAAKKSMESIYKQAAAEGFSKEDLDAMTRRAEGLSGQFREGEGMKTATAFVKSAGAAGSGRAILDKFQRGDQNRLNAQVLKQVASGYAEIAAAPFTVLGRALKGIDTENFSQEELEKRLQGLGKEDLQKLARENPFGARMAQNIREFQRGDVKALQRINEAVARTGDIEPKEEKEYITAHSGGVFTTNFWKDALRSDAAKQDDKRRWLAKRRQARATFQGIFGRQIEDSVAAESTARDAGIGQTADSEGRGGDALLSAAQELRETAQMFRDVIQGGSLDQLVKG